MNEEAKPNPLRSVHTTSMVDILTQLGASLVVFDPRFEILPGTKGRQTELAKANPYEAVPGQPIAE